MPYVSGVYSLPIRFGTGTDPGNTFPPQVGADLDDIASVLNSGIVNIKNFGAVGDGVANDTAAVNAAIASLTSGGYVYAPQGTYLITSTVIIPVGVSLIGAGWGSEYGFSAAPTTFHWGGSPGGTVFQTANQYDGEIGKFLIDAQTQNIIGLLIDNANGALFNYVNVLNVGSGGISFKTINVGAQNIFFNCSTWNNTGTAIGHYNNGSTGNSHFRCRYTGGTAGGIGLKIDSTADTNSFYSCDIVGDPALYMVGAGFNNNFYGGTMDPWGSSAIVAGNNGDWSQLYNVFGFYGSSSVFDFVTYTDDSAMLQFNQCYLGILPPSGPGAYGGWGCGTFIATVATGANCKLPMGAGVVVVTIKSAGHQGTALYLANIGSGDSLITGGGDFVAPTKTPAAGKCSIAWDNVGTPNTYRFYNATGQTLNVVFAPIRVS